MVVETSLSRLQNTCNKLSEENINLKTLIQEKNEKIHYFQKRYNQLEKDIEDKIEKAVKEAVNNLENEEIKRLTKENAELKERVFKLEQRLNISSETSNLPPSMDPIWHKDTKIYDTRSQNISGKNKGGQIGHVKNKLSKFNDEDVTEIIEYKMDECNKCKNKDLTFIGIETHDEIDFILKTKRTRHNFYKYECNNCGEIIKTKVPLNLSAECQYGPNVQALGLALVDFGDVSYKRTRDIIKGLTDGQINPCEGYLAKLPKKASINLKNFIFDCEEELVKSEIIQHDDGVIKIGKTDKDKEKELNEIITKSKEELTEEDKKKLEEEIKKNFKGIIRAYTNGEIKLYKAHTSKDSDTYKEDDILTRLKEDVTVVHDHMKYNYNDLFHFKNAECNIHPIRKGRGVKANTNHEWPDKIANLLEKYNEKREKMIKKEITEFEKIDVEYINTEYDKIIEEGIIECETFPHKHLYTDEINLLTFFKEYKEEILAWVYNWKIPFTNNLCESMIRLVKSKMKISYCFKNIETARYYADVITYTETCFNFGINRYQAIHRLFNNEPYTISELKKIKELNEKNKKINSRNIIITRKKYF